MLQSLLLGACALALSVGAMHAQQRTYAYAPCTAEGVVAVWCVEDGGASLRTAGTVRHPIGTRAPLEVVLHPKGGFAYILHAPSDEHGAAISLHRIDHRTGRLEFRAILLEAAGPLALELDPTGRHAYVVDAELATLRMFSIDAAFGSWRERHTPMPTGNGPCQVLLDPHGKFLFVLNRESCSVSRYRLDDLGRPELAGEDVLLNGSRPVEALMDPSGERLYVSFDTYALLLSMSIDPRDGGLRTINAAGTGGFPSGLALSANGGRIFVAERDSDSLSAFDIDPTTGQLGARLGPIPAGPAPTYIALAGDGRTLWVTGGGQDVRAFIVDGTTTAMPSMSRRTVGALGPLAGLGSVVTAGVAELDLELREDGTLVAHSARATPEDPGQSGAPVRQVVGSLGRCDELVVDPLGTWILALAHRPGRFVLVTVDARGRLRTPGAPVTVGHEVAAAAVAPGGCLFAVATRTPAAVHTYSLIDGAAQHLHTLPLSAAPDALQFDPTGRALFIAHTAADRLTAVALDEAGFMVRTTAVALAGGPGPLAVAPAGDVLFVGLQDTPGVVPCDISGRTRELVVRAGLSVEVQRAPQSLECSPAGEALLAMLTPGVPPVQIDRHPTTGALSIHQFQLAPEGHPAPEVGAGPREAAFSLEPRARPVGTAPTVPGGPSATGSAASSKGIGVRATARFELALPRALDPEPRSRRGDRPGDPVAPVTARVK